jgi:MFS family permease
MSAPKQARCDPRAWPFAAAALATFADYLGLSLMTPALPFYLNDIGVDGAADVAVWNGAINTSQFIAVVIGNLVWGFAGDRLGSKRALQLAMVGDTLFYAATAAVANPSLLVAVRFGCGLSTPLVPALLYIFERVRSPEDAIRGVGRYTISIMTAYCVGGILISFAYSSLGWVGCNLLAAGVCGVALLFTTFLSSPVPGSGTRPKPQGIRNALSTAAFVNHATCAFVQGSAFNILILLLVLLMKDSFGLTAREAGYVFVFLPVILFTVQVCISRAVKRFGFNLLITSGALLNLVCVSSSMAPAVQDSLAGLLTVTVVACCCMVTQMLPNQSKAKAIATAYATNAVGAVTGMGRVFFALGQGTAPIIAGSLYTIGARYAYGYWIFLQAAQLVVMIVSRQPLFHDPPLGNDAPSNPTATVAPGPSQKLPPPPGRSLGRRMSTLIRGANLA